jgi:choice-of-anchor C domain-containing protein/LSD1 subclass zinc finger protein
MSILVDCPGHGGSLHLPDGSAGKRVRCPACQTVFTVPEARRSALVRGPIPRRSAAAEAETIRESIPSRTTPDRGRARIAPPRRPNVKGASAGQKMVIGMIGGCLLVLAVVAVGAVILTRRAGRSSTAPDSPSANRGAGVEKGKNLIVNGSFEEGPDAEGTGTGFQPLPEGSTAIRGWVVTRGSIDLIGSYWQHAEGQRSLDLNGLVRGGVAQTFKTTKGQRYRVTFSMSGNPTLAEPPPLKTLGVRADDASSAFAFDTTGRTCQNMVWVTITWEFVATRDQTTLEFYSLSGKACGPALDNVSVVAID